MARRKLQERPSLTHVAFYPTISNDQATLDKPKEWFWRGLERFVNTGDSLEGYRNLAKAWPTFWPMTLEVPRHHSTNKSPVSLNWRDETHPLFLFYRNVLRALWTRDPATSTNGTYINVLFGLIAPVEQLKKIFPRFNPAVATTSFWPEWGAGVIRFISYTDFQRTIWALFCESWRAKVCASCSLYFIAEKPAQGYCSISCSNRAHQSSSLRWWREKGAKRRTKRTKTKQ
jgi:hypothetical protein